MGNRAVIAFKGSRKSDKCIYLHWNGGRASVEAFLQAAKDLNIRPRNNDTTRSISQLAGCIGPWFFGNDPGFTVYIEKFKDADTDNWDNGLYWISDDFQIVGRDFVRNEEERDPEKTREIRNQIVSRAPIFND